MSLLKLILLPFWYLSSWIPRNRNIWVFGSNTGNSYGDNTRYFFEYILENHTEIKAVWITRSEAIYQKLKSQGYPVTKMQSYRAKWICLRAGKGFTTHGKNDLCNEFTKGIVLYNLWHGMPIKTIGHIPPKNILKRWYYRLWYPQKWNHFFITSEMFRPVMEQYHINSYKPVQELNIMGMPRYDRYNLNWEEKLIRDNKNKFGEELKFILYCPTYREQNEFEAYSEYGQIDIFENYGFDPSEVQNLMEELNAIFLVKMHPMATDNINLNGNFDRIKIVEGAELDDMYTLIKDVDVLLSDYSSLLFDYLVLDRPIIHTVFDLELYKKIRTFNFDYEEIVSGPKTTNWPSTLSAIKDCLEQDSFQARREMVNGLINTFPSDISHNKALYDFCIRN